MDKCLYKNKVISAEDFAKSFESETELRKNTHLLVCCDPECHGELIFRNGPIKTAHFAHKKSNSQCCYNEYSSQMDDTKKKVRDDIFEQMNSVSDQTGYSANFDMRISNDYRHITSVTLCGNKNFAVDIMYCNNSANALDRIRNSYKNIGYLPTPIIIEAISDHFNDMNDTYYTLRYWLHNPDIQNLIVYNNIQKRYYMCRLDSDAYDFNGQSTDIGLINVFVMSFNLSDLSISDYGFYVSGFENAYNEWKRAKHIKLEDLFIQEQNKAAIKAKLEEEQKEALLKKEQEAVERKQKKQLELRQLLINEGMFEDKNKNNGKPLKIKIEEVTVTKGAKRYLGKLGDDEMIEKLNKIFNGDVTTLKTMLNVMSYPYPNEKAIFKNIYDDYLSKQDNGTAEDCVRLRILEHIKIFTELSF